jgi:hypothetical protein
MTSKTVLYFLAGNIPTTPESVEIAKIVAAGPSYVLRIRNGGGGQPANPNYGAGPETADLYAGTPPAAYANTTTYPRLDPTAIPVLNLLATQVVINSGFTHAVTGTGTTATVTIAGGVITGIALS